MKAKLEMKLVKKYPKLMKNYNGNKRETCFAYGFQHNDGWYDLIDILCKNLQSYIDLNKKEQIVIEQVKEKFGGLRFYVRGGDDYTDGIISFAETMSYYICEDCGTNQNVEVRNDRWIRTLCDSCEKGRNKE